MNQRGRLGRDILKRAFRTLETVAAAEERTVTSRPPALRLARPAFTLIEVLVVVVIIAVLASIVAPNVFRHVDIAKNVTVQAQISTLGAALDA